LQNSSVIDHWVKVLLICIVVSSLGITIASVAQLTARVFPIQSSILHLATIGGILLASSCSLYALTYSRKVAQNLGERSFLFRRAKQVGLQLVKMGLSLGSLSVLPLAYLFLRPFLNSYNTITQIFPFYLWQAIFPFDIYILCLIFILCFSPACFLLATGLVLQKKGKVGVKNSQ